MKNIFYVLIIFILILSNCTKKNVVESNDKKYIEEEITESFTPDSTDYFVPDTKDSFISDSIEMSSNIYDIAEYITNALNLDFNARNRTSSIEELLKNLGIIGEYKILNENRGVSPHDSSIILCTYKIECGAYIVGILSQVNVSKYDLTVIEIIINENNYNYLFPYKTMDEYIKSDGFGRVDYTFHDNNMDYIRYELDDFESIDLAFLHGSLYSVRIVWGMP